MYSFYIHFFFHMWRWHFLHNKRSINNDVTEDQNIYYKKHQLHKYITLNVVYQESCDDKRNVAYLCYKCMCERCPTTVHIICHHMQLYESQYDRKPKLQKKNLDSNRNYILFVCVLERDIDRFLFSFLWSWAHVTDICLYNKLCFFLRKIVCLNTLNKKTFLKI